MMLTLFIICSVLYALSALAVLYGLFGGMGVRQRMEAPPEVKAPFLTVIIPARNEAQTIGNTLHSLAVQDYDPELFEVIVVDDRSTDHTGNIAQSFSRDFAHLSVIQIEKLDGSGLFGKQNAVDAGVRAAKGEFIIQTDADCKLDSGFLKAYADAFSRGGAFVFSWTDMEPVKTLFERLQASDLGFLFSVAAGTAKLGLPLSCMGNNMGFAKIAYLDLGGYPSLGPSPVEDYQLLTAFRKNKYPIRFAGMATPVVKTAPLQTWQEFLFQRVRWARGAALVNPPLNVLTLTVLLANTLTLVYLAGLPWMASSAGVYAAMVKIIADGLFFSMGSRYFGRKPGVIDFLIWEAYYLFSPLIFLVLMVVLPKRRWR